MKRLLLILIGLALPVSVSAQTTTATASWITPDSVTAAQGFTYSLKDGSNAAVTLTNVTCAVSGSSTKCSAPIAVPGPGSHSYVLTITGTLGSSVSGPFTGTTPSTVQITITVTVSTGQ